MNATHAATKETPGPTAVGGWVPNGDLDPRLAWGVNVTLRDLFFDGYLLGGDYPQITFWLTSDATFRRRAVERFGPHHVVWVDIARPLAARVAAAVEQSTDINTQDGVVDARGTGALTQRP